MHAIKLFEVDMDFDDRIYIPDSRTVWMRNIITIMKTF